MLRFVQNYQLQYKDPITGRKKTRSSGIERTGRKQERAEAEKAAGKLQSELQEGRHKAPARMTWDDFRLRHETEVQPSLAPGTGKKYDATFNRIEELMAPTGLRQVTTQAISEWVAELQKGGGDR